MDETASRKQSHSQQLAGNGCLPHLRSTFALMMQEYFPEVFNPQPQEVPHDRATSEND
jgi:hypothetical protein